MKRNLKTIIMSGAILFLLASCATTKGFDEKENSVKTEKTAKKKKQKKGKFDQNSYNAAFEASDYDTCISMLSEKKEDNSSIKTHLDINMLKYFTGDFIDSGRGFLDIQGEMQQVSSDMTAGKIIQASLAGENTVSYTGTVYERLLAYSMRAVNAIESGQLDVAKGVVYTYTGDYKDVIVPLIAQQKEIENSSNGLLESEEIKKSIEVLKTFNIDIPLFDWTKEIPAKASETYETSPFLSYLGTVIFAADNDFDHAKEFSSTLKNSKIDMSETLAIPAGKGHIDIIAMSGTIGKRSSAAYNPMPLDVTALLLSAGQLNYDVKDSHLNLNFKISYPKFDKSEQNHRIKSMRIRLSDGTTKDAVLIENFDDAVAVDVAGKARGAYYRSIFRNITKSAATLTAGVAGVVTADQAVLAASENPLTLKGSLIGYNKAVEGLQKGLDAISNLESADIRQGEYFPHMVSAAGFSVNPGTYNATVEYLDANNNILETKTIENIVVKEGKVSVAVASCEK